MLVTPGNARRMHARALATPADLVILDLEDAVAPAAKADAREIACALLSSRVGVRVNAPGTPQHADDLRAASAAMPDACVVVPKVESVADVTAAATLAGADARIHALLETPAGLEAASAIAAAPQVEALVLGYVDLAAALSRRGMADWLVHQERVVAAARAAGVLAIDGPFVRLDDAAGLRRHAERARTLGFDGGWAIHPAQVPVLAAAYGPSAAEEAWARAVLEALDIAAADGGAAARVGGTMVDEATGRHAERLLARRPVRRAHREDRTAPARDPMVRRVGPPHLDDLQRGQVFEAPALTLTAGHAALHQAIVGDRLPLALDAELSCAVTGRSEPVAHPALVWDVAIGQSTPPSGRVLGNLFYRGVVVRPAHLGDTLRTRTEVIALRASRRPGRGMAVLRARTTDHHGAPVADLVRCPLLPARDVVAHADDLDDAAPPTRDDAIAAAIPERWDLAPLGRHERPVPGDRIEVEAADTVTAAPELARLTLNVAMTHTDARAGAHGRRLVYGGHVVGVATAHLARALPGLVTVLAWRSCDHLGPCFEGDRLTTAIDVVRVWPSERGGALADLRVTVAAGRPGGDAADVLDWRPVALLT